MNPASIERRWHMPGIVLNSAAASMINEAYGDLRIRDIVAFHVEEAVFWYWRTHFGWRP